MIVVERVIFGSRVVDICSWCQKVEFKIKLGRIYMFMGSLPAGPTVPFEIHRAVNISNN